MSRATTAKLQPGQHTIDRSKPFQMPNGVYRLQWSIVLPNGLMKRPSSFGATKGEARRRAYVKADELLNGGGSQWNLTTPLKVFIEAEAKPAMTKAPLSDPTRKRYEYALELLLGNCAKHLHEHGLKDHTIASGIRFKPLEALLNEIATHHGLETARQARTVLGKYIVTRLVRDELVAGNPIAGIRLTELTGVKKPERTRGGKALRKADYKRVLRHLLALDPVAGYTARQGRWNAATVAKRRNAIDQLLLQMATGLRSTEANKIWWSDVHVDNKGVMTINVTKDVAKGGYARVAIVLQPKVARRLMERRDHANGQGYVIGSPADPTQVWEYGNRNRAAADLYKEVAADLGIDLMTTERSHMWRTTLRAMFEGKVPPAVLNAQFGHSEQTAQRHYVDPSDLRRLAKAAGLTNRQPEGDPS